MLILRTVAARDGWDFLFARANVVLLTSPHHGQYG
jgi:hypothetical protein